jgi:hypothetical protein
MLHRIRLAMQQGNIEKLSGHVEVDQTFIGGKARNRNDRVSQVHYYSNLRGRRLTKTALASSSPVGWHNPGIGIVTRKINAESVGDACRHWRTLSALKNNAPVFPGLFQPWAPTS